MKYAVIKTGGKQYRVSEGDVIEVERLTTQPEKTITFDEVLLVGNEGEYTFGFPTVDGVTVSAMVLENTKGDKIRVGKFKAKARYRRVTGHRQSLSKIRIDTIGLQARKTKKTEDTTQSKAVKA